MDLIRSLKNETAKLRRSIRSRLTRRSRSRIAPEPAELPPFDSTAASLTSIPESVSSRRVSLSPIAESLSPRLASLSPRLASLSPRRASVSPRLASLSPRRVSLSPTTKAITHIQRTFRKSKRKREQTLADLSKLNSKRLATRRIQKKFRRARASANPNLQCPICLGTMLQPKLTQTLRCCHIFHRKCLKENNLNPICPICRTSIVPEQPHDLKTRLSMPISFNINIANTDVVIDCVNTLIAGILNAATIQEAQVLLDESDVLIHSLPYNKRGELATKRIQARFKAYPRLEELRAKQLQARRAKRSKKTNDAINRANELIASMYSATTKEQLTEFLDESSLIINNLPSDEEEKEELTNRQWTTWMRAYTRLTPPIHRRG
jgi:hypothetical protein